MRVLALVLAILVSACAGPRGGRAWVAELWGAPERGRQRVVLWVEVERDGRLSGGSRRGALSAVTGSRLVAAWERVTPRGGSLVEIERSGVARAGELLELELDTPVGALALAGVWTPERYEGEWAARAAGGALRGGFAWTPRAPELARAPLDDYPALLDAFAGELERRFVFPERLADPEWRSELAAARERAAGLADDFEFVGLVLELCEPLAPGTLCLRGARLPEGPSIDVGVRGDVAVVALASLADALAPIDRALETALAGGPRALVLDLRGAVGFDLTAARLASWLVEEPTPAGMMLGRARADRGPPAPEERDALPVVYGTYDLGLYRAALAFSGLAAGGVAPRAEGVFRGPVAILVDGETRGSVEPVVELLQRTGRARVVGAPTAGASVDVALFDLPEGWTALIPIATWVTWEGRWMERDPVRPDVACDPADALETALELLSAG